MLAGKKAAKTWSPAVFAPETCQARQGGQQQACRPGSQPLDAGLVGTTVTLTVKLLPNRLRHLVGEGRGGGRGQYRQRHQD